MAGRTSSGPPRSALLYGLVFASGVSSLIFEIVWIRALGLSLGTSTPSIATVVAAYMLGLALGSWLLGRAADRHPSPLELYRHLELGIAISGLVVSLVLLRGSAALVVVAKAVGVVALPASLQTLVRAALALLLFVVPTTLMGGTLPVLARVVTRWEAPGKGVGLIYAVNTAGAVVGALLPDALAVPRMGLLDTAFLAAAGDLVVALLAGRLARSTSEIALASTTEEDAAPALDRRVLFLFAVSGFCALGYELAWSRVVEYLAGGMVIGFSILLAVYLAALALGSALAGPIADRTRHPLQWAGLALAGSALSMLLPLSPHSGWHGLLRRYLATEGWTMRMGDVYRIAVRDSLVVEGVAALLMGIGLPFLAAATVRSDRAGRTTGRLYAVNTLAGVCGSVMTGFVLIPHLGLQRTLAMLCTVAAVGAVVGSVERGAGWRLGPTLAVAALVIARVIGQPPGELTRDLLGLGEQPLALEEGATTTAAVVSSVKLGVEAFRTLLEPGVAMSNTSFTARRYMGLMGHLPLLFSGTHPGPRDALLICYGVGNTARALLSHPEVRHLDVVDLAPEVLRLSPWFAQVTGADPLRDPRTTVTVEDGRFFLATSGRTYDVITAEPPPPTFAGVSNLYSREYYALARRALRPGGVVAQWLPRFLLTPREMLAIIAAMQAELGHVALFYGSKEEWILLGSDRPLEIDLDSWVKQTSAASVQADFHLIGLRGVEDLVATYMQTNAGLRVLTEPTEAVTDDWPMLQYPDVDIRAPPLVPEGLVADPRDILSLIRAPVNGIPPEIPGAVLAQRRVVGALSRRYDSAEDFELEDGTQMLAALAEAPGQPDAFSAMQVDDDDVRAAQSALARNPGNAAAAFALARRAFYAREWALALQRLEGIPPDAVGPARYWLLRAGAERSLGRIEAATASLARAATLSRDPRFQAQVARLTDRGEQPLPLSHDPWRVSRPDAGSP